MADLRLKLAKGTGPKIDSRSVILPAAWLRTKPKSAAPVETQLLFGQRFDVHVQKSGWVYGRARSLVPGPSKFGPVGWVRAKELEMAQGRTRLRVSAMSAPVFSAPDIKSPIIMSLPMNARLRSLERVQDFVQIGAGAYVHNAHISAKPEVSNFINVAARFVGQPYVWGGTGERGVDCSGLVQMALAATGVDAPRDADQQEDFLKPARDARIWKPGDFLFWDGHIAILADVRTLLHANAHHMAVVTEPVEAALLRMGDPRSIRRLPRKK